jgi:hypothetical protein
MMDGIPWVRGGAGEPGKGERVHLSPPQGGLRSVTLYLPLQPTNPPKGSFASSDNGYSCAELQNEEWFNVFGL